MYGYLHIFRIYIPSPEHNSIWTYFIPDKYRSLLQGRLPKIISELEWRLCRTFAGIFRRLLAFRRIEQ